MKKAVVFAPLWGHAAHVGNNRLERFVRWLQADGFHVVMVRAGQGGGPRAMPWGEELAVRDPLGLYRDPPAAQPGAAPQDATDAAPVRRPNRWRRALAYRLFNPDPGLVWARHAAASPMVRACAAGASFVLSSSPPESVHVGAWLLARRLRLPHLVDMRDGWLDEPLKPLLQQSALRRWQEGRLERRILSGAARVLVTSDVWRDLLAARLPQVAPRLQVLTNGYPPSPASAAAAAPAAPRLLIHAGRFSGSDTRRTPDRLLRPLLEALRAAPGPGVVRLLGALDAHERLLIEAFSPAFAALGWAIDCPGVLPRRQVLDQLAGASGLLLLSASQAAIPSKLFEYIPTGRPLFVVTAAGSAAWNLCRPLAQAHCVDSGGTALPPAQAWARLLDAPPPPDVPRQFCEAALQVDFARACAAAMEAAR